MSYAGDPETLRPFLECSRRVAVPRETAVPLTFWNGHVIKVLPLG